MTAVCMEAARSGGVQLFRGHVLEVLRALPDASVDCVVTSPPYFGLRDYGTATWEAGDPECDHLRPRPGGTAASGLGNYDNRLTEKAIVDKVEVRRQAYRDVCRRCGALRVDQQIGLEASPDEYVATIVEVFGEVRRVLAPEGVCWLNLGDSYVSQPQGSSICAESSTLTNPARQQRLADALRAHRPSSRTNLPGLKPKDLIGIPWRVALALQADGWWLRSDVVWSKPNPMPESVKDRPSRAHEYLFMLTKSARYWYDDAAVRQPDKGTDHSRIDLRALEPSGGLTRPHRGICRRADAMGGLRPQGVPVAGSLVIKCGVHIEIRYREGRNGHGASLRTVWTIPTAAFPEAHFATFPPALVARSLLAACPREVCRGCAAPRRRLVEPGNGAETTGWSDCGCGAGWRPGVVLDPFIGSGTTALVARQLARHCVGIDLSADYLAMARRRLGSGDELDLLLAEERPDEPQMSLLGGDC